MGFDELPLEANGRRSWEKVSQSTDTDHGHSGIRC